MIDVERMNQQMAAELGGALRQHNQNIANLCQENNRLAALVEELKEKRLPDVARIRRLYLEEKQEKEALEKKVKRLEKQVKHLINEIEE